MSDNSALQPLISDLLDVVCRLASLHEEMAELIDAKLRAMRGGDIPQLRELADQEGRLLRNIAGQRDRRIRIAELAGRKLGMSVNRARGLPLKQWAQYSQEPLSTQIQAEGLRLKRTSIHVARLNHLAGEAANRTLAHMSAILTPAPATQDRLYEPHARGGAPGDELINFVY